MAKFYRVKKDTFMWDAGAILEDTVSAAVSKLGGYTAVNDLFNHTEKLGTEYISSGIIEAEDNKDFFERVYPVSLLTKVVYKTKAEARELFVKEFKE